MRASPYIRIAAVGVKSIFGWVDAGKERLNAEPDGTCAGAAADGRAVGDKIIFGIGMQGLAMMKAAAGMEVKRLLIVEDDVVLLGLIESFFAQRGVKADLVANGREALEKLSSLFYDLIITDLHIPVMDGLSLLEWIKDRHPCAKVVVMSGDNSPENIIMAMRAGAIDYLLKPFRMADLLEVIERCGRKIEPANQASLISLVRQLTGDLRGELVNLAMMARLLERGHYGDLGTAVADQIGKSREKIQSMIAEVEDYGEVAVFFGQGGMRSEEELDLRQDVILPILDELSLDLVRKGIKVTVKPLRETFEQVLIKGNRVLLRSTFRALLRAALRHSREEGTISLDISYNGRRFMVNVSDDSPGLPEELRQNLWDHHLFPADAVEQEAEDSLGAGLYLARNIVRQHGGELWYEGRGGDSQFYLTLPASC